MRNMSAPPRRRSSENSAIRLRLQRADAEDEEAAEADGQQDDARLIARAGAG